MPNRKRWARRNKSSSATPTTTVDHHESPTPEVETGAELADVVKVEKEIETEILGQVKVSNPNPVETDGGSTKGVTFSSESMVKEEVVSENCAVGDVNEAGNEDGEPDVGSDKVKEDMQLGSEDVDKGNQGVGVGTNKDGVVCIENDEPDDSIDKEKENLRQGSENVDEEKRVRAGKDDDGVVCIDGSQLETVAEISFAQEETAAVKVDDFKILYDNNTPLVVKGDGDEEGEEIAEVISAQESTVNKVPCKNDAVIVVEDGGNGDRKEIAEVISAQESTVSKAPCKNDAVLVVEDGGNGDRMGTAEIISTQISAQAVSTKALCENNATLAVEDDSKENGDDEESDDDTEGDDADSEGDEDPSLFVQDPLPDNKKDKNIKIYVGRLDTKTVEDDLVNVFQKFGELKSTRIVRNSTTKKSKGYAFLQFASVDQAKRALSELKDGVEVRGKQARISISQDNDTLYLGNICKTWKKEQVLQQLKHYGIEHIEMIRLPEDPKIDGKIKGFAFLEFSTHFDAVTAFQRLQKPDAIFGRDISAKVAFAQTPMHPSYEDLSQDKRVYVDGLAKTWNEEKVKDICKKYGEIVKIDLCQSTRFKRKDYGFVTFTSHESALACVEGINNAGIGEVKIKACIAKPQHKSRLGKQNFRGGFKVEKQSEASPLNKQSEISKETLEPKSSKMKGGLNPQQAKRKRKGSSKHKITASIAKPQQKGSLKKQSFGGEFKVEKQSKLSPLKKESESSKEAELSRMKDDLNSQQAKRKRKAPSKQSLKAPSELRHGDQGIPKKTKNGGEGQNSKTASKAGSRKRKKASKYEGHDDGGNRNTHSKKPLKKQKGNMHGREKDNSRNPKSDTHIRKGHDDYRNSTRYIDLYAPKYAASDAYHLGPDSLSTRRQKEMEPHAGYIEPASAKQSRPYSGYVQPVVRTHSQHQTVYLEPAAGSQSQFYPRYLDHSVMTQSHRGYIETAVGAEVQPYRGHRQSATVHIGHDPYDPGLARAVRHDGRGTSGLVYVGGPPPPASHVRYHTSYYQPAGGYSGAYSTRRTYY